MFLTTETSLLGRKYQSMQIIHTSWVKYTSRFLPNANKDADDWAAMIESALGELYREAERLGADGVIGVHHAMSIGRERGDLFIVTVMGTAIKFC